MIFSAVWDRYFKNFGGFAMTGLGVFLMALGSWVIMSIVMMVTLMPMMMRMARTMPYMSPNPAMGFEFGLQMMSAMLPMMIVMMVLSVFLYGFIGGGIMGAVVAHRRGAPVEFGTFWAYGARYFWRMTGLASLYMLVAAALGLAVYLPWIGVVLRSLSVDTLAAGLAMMPVMFLVWLVMMVVMSVLIVNTLLYPAYLIINDEKGVLEAYGTGWRHITRNFGEAMIGSLILMLFLLVLYVSVFINIIPLLGTLAWLAFVVFMLPFIALYYSERFEQRIRPTL